MKMIKTLGLTLAAAGLMAITAQAVPITGSITFAGGVTLDTASAGTATTVTTWTGPNGVGNPFVVSSDGTFATYAPFLSPVTIFAPYVFNSGPIASFWTVTGFTFDLISSAIDSQTSGSVSAVGTGMMHAFGYESTLGTWRFSTQDPSSTAGRTEIFSFSASTGAAVPDGGASLVLLGMGLMGLVAFRRNRA